MNKLTTLLTLSFILSALNSFSSEAHASAVKIEVEEIASRMPAEIKRLRKAFTSEDPKKIIEARKSCYTINLSTKDPKNGFPFITPYLKNPALLLEISRYLPMEIKTGLRIIARDPQLKWQSLHILQLQPPQTDDEMITTSYKALFQPMSDELIVSMANIGEDGKSSLEKVRRLPQASRFLAARMQDAIRSGHRFSPELTAILDREKSLRDAAADLLTLKSLI